MSTQHDNRDTVSASIRALQKRVYLYGNGILGVCLLCVLTLIALRRDDGTNTVMVIGDLGSQDSPDLARSSEMARDILMGVELAHNTIGLSIVEKLPDVELPGDDVDFLHSLTVAVVDDQGDLATARSAALAAIFDPNVMCVIGHSRSSTSQAALNYYKFARMPLLLPIATSTEIDLTERDPSTPIFRLPPSDSLQAISIERSVKNRLRNPVRPVAIMFSDDAYGRSLAEGVYSNLKDDIGVFPPIPLQAENSLAAQLLSIKQHVSGVVVCGYYNQASQIVSVLRRGGAKDEVPMDHATDSILPIFLSDGCVHQDIFKSAPLQIWRECYFFFPVALDDRLALAFDNRMKSWLKNNPRQYAKEIGIASAPNYCIYGYDAMYICIRSRSIQKNFFPAKPWLGKWFVPPRAAREETGRALGHLLASGDQFGLTGSYRYDSRSGERQNSDFHEYAVSYANGNPRFELVRAPL